MTLDHPMVSVAENVLATIGTVFWCIQLVPQIVRNYRVKNCEGLPPLMMFLWAALGVPFSIYFFGIDGLIPLRIQPQLFTFFCLVLWVQLLYYPPVKMERKRLLMYVVAFVAIAVGLEVGFILWLRPLHRRGKTWPMLIIGIIALVLLAVGLVPPYFELWKRRGRVVGINFIFLTMDSLGALFLMLLIIVGQMDVMLLTLYAIVLAMELGIFASQVIWYFLLGGRKIIKEEKQAAKLAAEEASDVAPNTGSDTGSEAGGDHKSNAHDLPVSSHTDGDLESSIYDRQVEVIDDTKKQ